MSVDLEALKRLRDSIEKAGVGGARPQTVTLRSESFIAMVIALERAMRVEAVGRKLVRRGPQSAVWAEFYDLVTELDNPWKPPAALAPAPGEEGK